MLMPTLKGNDVYIGSDGWSDDVERLYCQELARNDRVSFLSEILIRAADMKDNGFPGQLTDG